MSARLKVVPRIAPKLALVGALLAGDFLGAMLGRDAAAIWVFDSTAPYIGRAPLDFELIVEKFVFLQIGSAGSVIDEVRFDLGAATVADPLPGSSAPVDAIAGGSQQVIVRGNQGSITMSVAGAGSRGLSNGSGAWIGYDQIRISSDNPALPAPVIDANGGASVGVSANAHGGLVTDQSANWIFRLANTLPVPGGTYRGQLGFTISMP